MSLTVKNPLALKGGSFTIGSQTTPKGYGNAGTMTTRIPAVLKTKGNVGTWGRGTADTSKQTGNVSTWGVGTGNTSSPTKKAASAKNSAQIAAERARAKAQADYDALKNTTFGSITDLVGATSNSYKSSLLDWQDEYKQKRSDINNAAVKNELAKIQGNRDVLDMVGNGIRSGGVMLNNSNATTSSAAQGIADAYGTIGRKEMSRVGNEYEMGREDIKTAEDQLAMAAAQQLRHAGESKDATVNSIVSQAVEKLGALNQSAAYAGLDSRVNVEAEKARIRAETLAALQQYDYILSQTTEQNKSSSKEDNFAKAMSQANAGVAPENAFQYNSSVPGQLRGTGPFSSSLPLFTYGG